MLVYTMKRDFCVVGAGPVGLATALLLAQQGYSVSVYESHADIAVSNANSYPIGVNARGRRALAAISEQLSTDLNHYGLTIDQWNIFAGTFRVASLSSGTVLSTTRADLSRLLLQQARATSAISIYAEHTLTDISLKSRTLTFTTESGDVTVDASSSRVIVADGVRSVARTRLAEQVPDFSPSVEDWGIQFRVLFSPPRTSVAGMNPQVHYIFTSTGVYAASLKDGTWCVVLTATHNDPATPLILSRIASPANVEALKEHVARVAPKASRVLPHHSYVDFFSRHSFSGAVVSCNRLAFDEWCVLIGDAAHSVIPPTGEGVNSGLEDAYVLTRHLDSETPFADFETARLPDLQALNHYARGLRDNVKDPTWARSVANTTVRIVDSVAQRLGLPHASVEDRLFGPNAQGEPYRDVLSPWIRQRQRIFSPLHRGLASLEGIGKGLRAK